MKRIRSHSKKVIGSRVASTKGVTFDDDHRVFVVTQVEIDAVKATTSPKGNKGPAVPREAVILERIGDLHKLRFNLQSKFELTPDLEGHIHALQALEQSLLKLVVDAQGDSNRARTLTVAVIGDFSAGKSTFINALLGENLCPVDVHPTTSSVTRFSHGESISVEEELSDGETRPISIATYKRLVSHKSGESSEERTFHIRYPSPLLRHLTLVDTPGFGNPENEVIDNARTAGAVQSADAIFVILDAEKGNPSATLLTKLGELRGSGEKRNGRPTLLLINKADLKVRSERTKIKERNVKKHSELFEDVLLISSLELVEAADASILSLVKTHTASIEKAIRSREPFATTLCASIEAGVGGRLCYNVSIDRGKIALPVPASDDLATRHQLTEIIDKIAERRIPLLKDRAQREFEALRAECKTELKGISLWAKGRMRLIDAALPPDELIKVLSLQLLKFREELSDIIVEIFKDALMNVFEPEDRSEKRVFSANKNSYCIYVKTSDFEKEVDRDVRWRDFYRTSTRFVGSVIYNYAVHIDIDLDAIRRETIILAKQLVPDLRKRHGISGSNPARRINLWVFENTERDRDAWFEGIRDALLAEYVEFEVSLLSKDFLVEVLMPELDRIRDCVRRSLEMRYQTALRTTENLNNIQILIKHIF